LYNVDNVGLFDDVHLRRISEEVASGEVTSAQFDTNVLNAPISREEVVHAINRAKGGKAVGLDSIPAEALKNNACVDILLKIFTFCFENNVCPEVWRHSIVFPIKKPDTDPRDPMGYRGISLLSIPCKVYSDILNTRFSKWLEINDLLAEEQNGFRSKRSTVEHIYSLYNIINNRKSKKLSTFVCYIDAMKAFDRVNRNCLWYKLLKLGVHGKFYSAVKSLYENNRSCVSVNGHFSEMFSVNSGVKQGCVLSPTLFSVFINDLVQDINDLNCGIDIDGTMVSLLLYADDIALMAADENSLQQMLNCVSLWCKKWRLQINGKKTKVVHYRPKSIAKSCCKFVCGPETIEVTHAYKYLGIWLNEYLDLNFTAKEIAKSASRALSVIISKFKSVGGMSYDVFNTLYDNMVQPILSYGSAIWGSKEFSCINVVQNRACRFFLGVGNKTPNLAVRGEMGWLSCITKQKIEVVRFWRKLNMTGPSRLVSVIKLWSLKFRKSWDNMALNVVRQVDFPVNNLFYISFEDFQGIKDRLVNIDKENWFRGLWNDRGQENGNKLRTFRLFKSTLAVSSYVRLVSDRSQRSVLAKLRCGSLPLEIELGRFSRPKTPLSNRICKFCNKSEIENESHFLSSCELYSDLRFSLWQQALAINPIFINISTVDQTTFLMKNEQLILPLAAVVSSMYKRRKLFAP